MEGILVANEYIVMMIDSLVKKNKMLEELKKLTNNQAAIVASENVDWEMFNDVIDQKAEIIDNINKMDEGFEKLFLRVKEELSNKQSMYKEEIHEMQNLIKTISEKSVEIEVAEKRNKSLIERRMNESKQVIKQGKLGNKAAAQYYQKMSKLNTVDPQMMDKKS